ncbi:hypothetical protein [Streptomyces sp. WG-D5]
MPQHSYDDLRGAPTDRGPSPWDAACIRRLTRCQAADRLPQLGWLYAANSGVEAGQWERLGAFFIRRLTLDMRRSGFALLIAEGAVPTACAYGFPLGSRLFGIREIVVPRRVRVQSAHREWNLARRLQRTLLSNQDRPTGVTVVDSSDLYTLMGLRAWGWRNAAWGFRGIRPAATRRVLRLDP